MLFIMCGAALRDSHLIIRLWRTLMQQSKVCMVCTAPVVPCNSSSSVSQGKIVCAWCLRMTDWTGLKHVGKLRGQWVVQIGMWL